MFRLLIVVLLIINALMLHKLFWTESSVFHYMEIRSSYNELEKKNKDLAKENQQLSRTIMALRNDRQYIERAIRSEMRYVRDNEVIYYFSDDPEP